MHWLLWPPQPSIATIATVGKDSAWKSTNKLDQTRRAKTQNNSSNAGLLLGVRNIIPVFRLPATQSRMTFRARKWRPE
ncbi:hypothetical protein AC244_08250 [Ensifer adhaerens]|uniref:Uncharacterized protein n=1 Tax=Ensifer adhaerens TaxID=106592 RepID=A0A0L8C360_ENSAD|nr:hypothetical protein AC244_08250 [Ensifer adhaerens]